MKQICIVLMGIAMLWALPVNAGALDFSGSDGTAGFAGFPFRSPGTVCGSNDGPQSSLTETPRVYFGWLEHSRGSTWALQRQTSTGTAPWPLQGFWLGASENLTLDDGFGLLVSESIFLPQRSAGTWYQSPNSASVDFEIPSYEWWSVDGLTKSRVSGALELLAGFRWDHTSTRVKYSDHTDDDYILNAYLPLIGIQVNQPFSSGSMLVRFVGSPVVAGRMRYDFWTHTGYAEFGDFDVSGGSFLEFFGDYFLKVTSDLSVGGFVRWNSLHVKTVERNLSGSTTEPVSWTIDIQSWTLGGTLSLGFSSPI